MHISDGMLPTYAWTAGCVVAGLAVAADLRRVHDRDVPKLALLASTFFVASLVHVPLGPASIHLTLNGLVGIVAGPGTVLVIAMGLLLQALLFGHGGLTSLGVNIVNMALPALLVASMCRWRLRSLSAGRGALLAGLCGTLVPVLSLGMVLGWSAFASDPAYTNGLRAFLLASLPVCILEGLICGATISYLLKVQPSVLRLDRTPAGEPAGATPVGVGP